MFFLLIAALLVAFTSLYFYLKHKYSYWSRRGIPGPPPLWFIGNIHQQIGANGLTTALAHMRQYGHLFGVYIALKPALVVSKPDLVKRLLVKDFAHFTDRMTFKNVHPFIRSNLFNANGDDWRRLRVITSPSFSSGKLRGMAPLMGLSIDKLEAHLTRLTETPKGAGIMETKKITSGFTIDIISSTAFAYETNANADAAHPVVVNSLKMLSGHPLRGVASFVLPNPVLKLLDIETPFPTGPFKFFTKLTSHIVKLRRESAPAGPSGRPNDLVQLMIDASVEESELLKVNYEKMSIHEGATVDEKPLSDVPSAKGKLTDDEIIANCIFFFIAGYETTASALAHTLFELARNSDIQERLRRELNEALEPFDSPDSSEYFDTVMSRLPYLEAVIKETLRRYPPVINIIRECATDGYQLTPEITLSKGQQVFIPMPALHLSPDYFPEPMRFNPERFMPENKANLVPYTYLPFSVGPRNCIAMRFAYQELKLCLATIARKYTFTTTPETPAELTFKTGGLAVASPFQLKVCRR